MLAKIQLVIILVLNVIQMVYMSTEEGYTVFVEPGKEDCFYQKIKKDEIIEFEYQVIDGGHGDLDITFRLVDPTGRVLVVDYKKSEYNHRINPGMEGDYKFCFDNSFSSYNSKTVFFELVAYRSNEDGTYESDDEDLSFQPEVNYEITIQEITQVLSNVKDHLKRVRHLQDLIKSTEARDRNVAEENYFKVNTYSLFQLCLMLIVGFIQVVMVKSLFDEKSKAHKVWKNLDKSLR